MSLINKNASGHNFEPNMRVIFLDIDGVLNSELYIRSINFRKRTHQSPLGKEHHGCWGLCPYACAILDDILIELPDVNIVVSYCWRVGRTIQDLQSLFDEFHLPGKRIVGKTGRSVDGETRGDEIQHYLDVHPEIEDFVIIDDDSDMKHLLPKLVQTDGRNGLLPKDADEVIRRLRG